MVLSLESNAQKLATKEKISNQLTANDNLAHDVKANQMALKSTADNIEKKVDNTQDVNNEKYGDHYYEEMEIHVVSKTHHGFDKDVKASNSPRANHG